MKSDKDYKESFEGWKILTEALKKGAGELDLDEWKGREKFILKNENIRLNCSMRTRLKDIIEGFSNIYLRNLYINPELRDLAKKAIDNAHQELKGIENELRRPEDPNDKRVFIKYP
ncbi:MAG: hypothetical protein Q8N71_02965 [candidate division Zixibacteria bacterium]|nr:hypothetical protein [candidate division Zixibacteria bacterium]